MTKIVMVNIEEIIPYENNPRINDKTVQRLVNLIPRVGFDVPLVLDSKNRIIKGHARYKAAVQLGMKQLPCIYSDNPDDINAFDRIADNKVHEFTVWDEEQRAHEIDMINTDYDFAELGLSAENMDDIGFSFDDDEDNTESMEVTDEERRQRFLDYIASKHDIEPTPVITTEADIARAEEKVTKVTKEPEQYVLVHCKHCGKAVYVKKNKYVEL